MNYYNYFTEIEEHFVRRRGKHLLISPMDWGLIAQWREAGVPLHVALRGIDIAMDSFTARNRGNSKVNTLCYCHDSVMTEYATHLEAHVGESTPDAQPSDAAQSKDDAHCETKETLEFLAKRTNEIRQLISSQCQSQASEGISRTLARLEEILIHLEAGKSIDSEMLDRDLSIIDELLTSELQTLVSPEIKDEWEKEAKAELKVYKKRLPKETYEKIRANFLKDKIHKHFKVGELSIFRL
jgi:hypothetical protein